MYCHNFLQLTGDVLTSIAVGAGQRIVGTMLPTASTQKETLPADRATHNADVKRRFVNHDLQFEALSSSITQLVALEYVLFERLLKLQSEHERHEETTESVCVDCDFTGVAQ